MTAPTKSGWQPTPTDLLIHRFSLVVGVCIGLALGIFLLAVVPLAYAAVLVAVAAWSIYSLWDGV